MSGNIAEINVSYLLQTRIKKFLRLIPRLIFLHKMFSYRKLPTSVHVKPLIPLKPSNSHRSKAVSKCPKLSAEKL